jgi:hypothetical protein
MKAKSTVEVVRKKYLRRYFGTYDFDVMEHTYDTYLVGSCRAKWVGGNLYKRIKVYNEGNVLFDHLYYAKGYVDIDSLIYEIRKKNGYVDL